MNLKSAIGKRCQHTWSWHLVMSERQTSPWWRRIIHSGNNTRLSPPYCIHTLAHNALQARVTQETQYTITTHLSHVSPVFHETLNFIFHLHKYLSENVLFQFFKLPISLSNSFKVTKCKVLNKCFLCVWGALLFNNFPLVRCPTKPYQRKKTCQPNEKVVYLTIIPRGRVGYEMIDSQWGA